jgi:hypothetical protein
LRSTRRDEVDGTDDPEDENELAIEQLAELQDANTGPDDTVPAQGLKTNRHPPIYCDIPGKMCKSTAQPEPEVQTESPQEIKTDWTAQPAPGVQTEKNALQNPRIVLLCQEKSDVLVRSILKSTDDRTRGDLHRRTRFELRNCDRQLDRTARPKRKQTKTVRTKWVEKEREWTTEMQVREPG